VAKEATYQTYGLAATRCAASRGLVLTGNSFTATPDTCQAIHDAGVTTLNVPAGLRQYLTVRNGAPERLISVAKAWIGTDGLLRKQSTPAGGPFATNTRTSVCPIRSAARFPDERIYATVKARC
jgi:hypothetical protein